MRMANPRIHLLLVMSTPQALLPSWRVSAGQPAQLPNWVGSESRAMCQRCC